MAINSTRGVLMLLTCYTFFLLSMGLYGYFFAGSRASLTASAIFVLVLGVFQGLRSLHYGGLTEFSTKALIATLSILVLYFLMKMYSQPKIFPTLILIIATATTLAWELYLSNTQKQSRLYQEVTDCEESQFLDR